MLHQMASLISPYDPRNNGVKSRYTYGLRKQMMYGVRSPTKCDSLKNPNESFWGLTAKFRS